MSRSGELVFYSEEPYGEPTVMTERLLRYLGVAKAYTVARTIGEDREWDAWKAEGGGVGGDQVMYSDRRRFDVEGLGPVELAGLYEDGCHLFLNLESIWFSRRIESAVSEQVPADLRRDYVPSDLCVSVGYHDIWEAVECREGQRFCRAFCSIRLFGYSTPCDWAATRVAILGLAEVEQSRQEIQEIIGPTGVCVYWDN